MGILDPGFTETPMFVDAMCAMGDRLVSLKWSGGRESRDLVPKTFGCCNLRKVVLTEMKETSVDMLRVILGEGPSGLTDVELSFADTYVPMDEEDEWLLDADVHDEARYSSAAVAMLAKHCEFLKRFSLKSVPIEPDVLEDFCAANEELESVQLSFKKGWREDTKFEDWDTVSRHSTLHLLEAADSLSRCAKLQSVDISDLSYLGVKEGSVVFPKVAEACLGLRDRMVNVVVCGVHYFV